MWWKQHKWKILIAVLVIAILAFAFWYGGDSPDSRGWSADEPAAPEVSAPADSQPAAPADESEDAPSAPEAPSEQTDPAAPAKPTDTQEEPDAPTEEPDETADPNEVPEAPAPSDETADVPAEPEALEMVIDPETGKDQYQTDPVPEGKPLPVEPQDVQIGTTAYTCTLSISCATILDNMDLCDPEKVELVPEDGWILKPVTVTFYEGESVFNVLQRTCKQQLIHMEFENTPIYNSAYIEAIGNLYEFDVGELSGWMYKVNEWFPNYGCSRYQLKNGDVINWVYTCDLGSDVGGDYAAGGNVREE